MAEATEVWNDLSQGIEDFRTNIYKYIADETKENFVISTLGAHIVLSMAAYGAEGNTTEIMRQVLHLPKDDLPVHQEFKKLIDFLHNVPDITLVLANKIYASNVVSLKKEFKDMTRLYFNSEIEELGFWREDLSAKTINHWCDNQTVGKIKEIISAIDIDKNIGILLLSAAYFKGSWKHAFDKEETELKPFHLDKGTSVRVPTMQKVGVFFHKELPELNAECVALPYVNEEFVMVIIVPKDVEGLKNIEAHYDKINLHYDKDFETNLYQYKFKMHLWLPKFEIRTTIDWKPYLNNLGLTEMFEETANFKSIAEYHLKVDKVIQKTFIEINERGSDVVPDSNSTHQKRRDSWSIPPYELRVDRPFLFRIIDTHRHITLFNGRVVRPIVTEDDFF